MKYRLIQFLLSVLVLCNVCVAQTESEVVKLVNEYKQKVFERDWAGSLEYLYPALFNLVPKETFLEKIEETMNDTLEYVLGYEAMQVEEISKVYEEDSISYCMVKYTSVMTYRSKSEDPEDILGFLQIAKAVYGEDALQLDGNLLTITTPKRLSVIKELGDNKLYFVELSKDAKRLLSMIMSQAFINLAYPE
jgi:hypothetical protein